MAGLIATRGLGRRTTESTLIPTFGLGFGTPVAPGETVTDVIGFCCLIPQTRRLAADALIRRFRIVAMTHQHSSVFVDPDFQQGPRGSQPRQGSGDIIDGEYRREDDS